MSKKIIYLLSLLIALSLVFASCKKNAAGTGPDGGLVPTPPTEEDNTGDADQTTGLYDDFTKIPATDVIKKETVFEGDGVNYLRNPVVVVMGPQSNQVAIFAEKRYKSPGADNDVGINGTDSVDIVVRVSVNAGIRFGGDSIVGTPAAGPDNSHGAPVVYKVADNKVVVVASAGGGIARTAQPASDKMLSKIEYIVGTLNGESFSWGDWKVLDVPDITTETGLEGATKLLTAVRAIKTGNGTDTFGQMGTHSAKGHVVNNNTLILPVVMAQQGTSSAAKELMGIYFLKGTFSNDDVTWEKLNADTSYVVFNKYDNNFARYKEARIIAGTSDTDVKYVVVPSRYGTTTFALGDGIVNQPTESTISGHYGSPGYLTLSWYGDQNYNPQEYSKGTSSVQKSLFLGVQDQNVNVTLYLVSKDTLTSEGSYLVNAVGKSGSIDVLGDGTIVTAAEEGANGDRNYYTSFTRYSQAYLTSLFQQ